MTDDPVDMPIDVHVFMDDSVAEATLSSVVRDLVASAARDGPNPQVGPIHTLAKSFSLIAPPSVVRAIAASPQVKSVVGNARRDAYLAPVTTRIVD